MKKRKTPYQQLMPLLTASQKSIITQALVHLKVDVAEDLCISLVAYIRFGLRRKYDAMFIDVLYQSFIDLIDHPDMFRETHTDANRTNRKTPNRK